MAGGWAHDGAEQEQIEATINDALQRARQAIPAGSSAEFCEECDQPIPKARQLALPGVQHCVTCQSKLELETGFNVYGLTTAGIIWIAAAVGMAIGFGEIFIAAVFLISAMAVINGAKVVTQQFIAYHQNKILKLSIPVENIDQKQIILNDLNRITKVAHEIGLEKEGNILNVTLDLHVTREQLTVMEMYLVTHPNITYFSF